MTAAPSIPSVPDDESATPPARGYFYRSFIDYFRDLPRGAQSFWVIVIVTGVAAGLVATAFMHLLRFVQHLAWPSSSSYLGAIEAAGPLQRVIVPLLAGVMVTALWLITRQKLSGHGTPGVIEAIWQREGRLSLPRAFLRDAASIVAVSMGAALGREGALIQTSAATGSWLSSRFKTPTEQARVLVACGAAAGIAAAYNAPIGAAVFGLEVLLGSFELELFGPIVVCCVCSTVVSRILIEDHATYEIPHFRMMTAGDFGLAILLGPLLGVISAGYVKGMDVIAVGLGKVPRPLSYLMPIVVMGALGVSAIWFPQLLGNGYDSVDRSLLGVTPFVLLLALPGLKFLASSLCSAAGVPGGLFTPSLYVGALLGGALGVAANRVVPGCAPVGACALIGMGCVLAGTTHAAVSSVLIVFELTGDYDVILPLMLGCVLAAHVSRALISESIYTASLRRRNVQLPERPRPEWLRRTLVSTVYTPGVETIAPSTPFSELLVALLSLPAGHDLYVVSDSGGYQGAVVLDALKGHIPDHQHLAMLVASDVMDASVRPVSLQTPLGELAKQFGSTALERLPVIDPALGKLVGTVSKTELVRRGRY